jgi:hypothetical protein
MRIHLARAARVTLLAAAALASVATSGPGPTPPEPDVCDQPPAPGDGASIDAIEIGRADGAVQTFTPLADGDTVTVEIGGQGASMLPIRLRVHGAAAPACLAQTTEVRLDDPPQTLVASETRPIATSDAGGDARTTDAIYLVLDVLPPDTGVTVTTTADGATATVRLQLQQ